MAITIDSAQRLQEFAKVYQDMVTKDIFSSTGEAFAAASDVLRGNTSASSLIRKHGGSMSATERERARNDLLKTLADYQKGRREDLRTRDKDRLDFLKEQYGNITGERRWAMEQVVALEKQRMQGQSTVTSARLNQLAAEMRDSDRKLEREGFREARDDNQRRAMIDAGTLVRVDKLIGVLQNKREPGVPMDAGTIASQFELEVGSVPAGQAEHVMKLLMSVVPNDFENAMLAATQDPSISGQYAAFRNTVDRALQEETQHAQLREDWQKNRDRVWTSFERQSGASPDSALIQELKNIFDESPEETTRRVNEMIESLPSDVTKPAEERELAPDAFTRQIQAQLDRLDDPRFMFAGSRHEQLKMEIMRSPEFQQYMAEKGDGGMIDPNEAFRMMLKETKAGLLTGNRDAQTVAAADARSLGGPPGVFPQNINLPGSPPSTLAPSRISGTLGRQATSRVRRRADQLRRELGYGTSPGGPKREMLRELGKNTMGVAEGFRDSAMKASQSAANVSRLMQQLGKQKEDE